MRIRALGWLSIRTDRFTEMVRLLKDVMGLAVEQEEPDLIVFQLPNGTLVEVFGPTSTRNTHFTTGPVVGFLVDDVSQAAAELTEAGIELIGPTRHRDVYGWQHFRGPDGRVYELTQAVEVGREEGS